MILIDCVQKRLLYGLFACASWVLHLERGGAHCVYAPVCLPDGAGARSPKEPMLVPPHKWPFPGSPRGAATQHKAEGLWGSFFPNLSCIAPHPSQLYSGTQVFFSF